MAAKPIRRAVLVAVVLAVAGLTLPPFINVGRYQARIIASMSEALGRPVSCASLELRLLPMPGFLLSNVTIGDDPSYSPEPILYADSVRAQLSVRSLWRGRMEFSRLDLGYPSLNLVEDAHGSWNLESLLWKASQAQTSPTGAGQRASRPRFPYIEASRGRINFKRGLTKSVFSFVDANFSLWSPAENEWHMRMEARPVRTDMPVSDTGVVKAEVSLRRAAELRDAPMKATLAWERVQMGNLTRLLLGQDKGWRGALEASARLSGTPAALRFSTSATLSDLRRFDILGSDNADLKASCEGLLNLGRKAIEEGKCRLPLDGGAFAVEGTVEGLPGPRYDLTLSAEDVGAGALLSLARRAKHGLPDDLKASGTVSASIRARRLGDAPSSWAGKVEIASLALDSSVLDTQLRAGNLLAAIDTSAPIRFSSRKGRARVLATGRALVLQPFDLPLGGSSPAAVDGSFDQKGFAVRMKGAATLERLQQVARALGISAPRFSLSGPADINLNIGGDWGLFDSPHVSGTAHLKNIEAKVPGIAEPAEISEARVEFKGNRFTLQHASARVGRVVLTGSASLPRFCDGDTPCQASFNLTTPELNVAQWDRMLNPHLKKRPWYFFGGGSGDNAMANLNASGELRAKRVVLGDLSGSDFATRFSMANRILTLDKASAHMLGGSVSGDWKLDWSGDEPEYKGSGEGRKIQAAQLAPLLGASPGQGTLRVRYTLRMSGLDEVSLTRSASAETVFYWSGGALRLSPEGRTPLRLLHAEGKAELGKEGWIISDSRLETPRGAYELRGTISRGSALDLRFSRPGGTDVTRLGGTLRRPRKEKERRTSGRSGRP
jgi:uncharacterized protein involved in outer membrane biogenesis